MVPEVPVPLAPEVIKSHAALEVALHVQEEPLVVTVTLPVPPVAAKLAVAGVRPVTSHAAPAWVTVWTWEPAVMVAVRLEVVAFAAMEYAIVPLAPAPVAPDVIVSHAALEVALHVHDDPLVVTVTVPLPDDDPTLAVAGLRPVTTQVPPPPEGGAFFYGWSDGS